MMYKTEVKSFGVIGVSVKLSNNEIMMLRDEVEDLNDFFEDRDMKNGGIDNMFSKENALKVKSLKEYELINFFEHLRNAYFIINKMTEDVKSSQVLYDEFFGLKEEEPKATAVYEKS